MGELDQLADSLVRARREHALAIERGDTHGAQALGAAVAQLHQLIAQAAQDYHGREGC